MGMKENVGSGWGHFYFGVVLGLRTIQISFGFCLLVGGGYRSISGFCFLVLGLPPKRNDNKEMH